MLWGGQTPSWTCQMLFSPAHCSRSFLPSVSPSPVCSFLLLFCWPFANVFHLLFIPHKNLHSQFLFFHHHLFLSQHFPLPAYHCCPHFCFSFSSLKFFSIYGTCSLLSNTFSIFKYITPLSSSYHWSPTCKITHNPAEFFITSEDVIAGVTSKTLQPGPYFPNSTKDGKKYGTAKLSNGVFLC